MLAYVMIHGINFFWLDNHFISFYIPSYDLCSLLKPFDWISISKQNQMQMLRLRLHEQKCIAS